MELFTLEMNTCNCHDETCACNDFKITLGAEKICTGNNEEDMKILVLYANCAQLQEEMEEVKKRGDNHITD